VFTCYEAGPFGYSLHRQLTKIGLTNYVIRPRDWDEYGKKVKTDKRDALAMALCLDRYVGGNREAFCVVRKGVSSWYCHILLTAITASPSQRGRTMLRPFRGRPAAKGMVRNRVWPASSSRCRSSLLTLFKLSCFLLAPSRCQSSLLTLFKLSCFLLAPSRLERKGSVRKGKGSVRGIVIFCLPQSPHRQKGVRKGSVRGIVIFCLPQSPERGRNGA
jgi:hypothetical protein